MIHNYRIGLVIGVCGLNEAQLADLGDRVSFIAKHQEPGSRIIIRAVSWDLCLPGETLPDQIIKVLAYKGPIDVEPLPAYSSQRDGVPASAWLYQQLRDCDEVWCCPGERQTYRSKARAAALYRYAQEYEGDQGDWLAQTRLGPLYSSRKAARDMALRYKLIPPWISAAPQAAKEKKMKVKPQLKGWK